MRKDIKQNIVRGVLFLAGFGFLIVGMALIWGLFSPWFTSFLMGSTLVAFSIATFWIAIMQSYRDLVGAGLSSLVAFGGAGIYLLQQQNFYGKTCLYIALISFWYFFLGLKASYKKSDFLPFSVQCLFAILLTLCLIEGVYLVIPVYSHFIWILSPEFSVIYGWTLIGISIFFCWALISPTWEVGYPILYAILVFDLFIIGPVLSLFKETESVAVVPFYFWSSLVIILGSGIWAFTELAKRFFARKKTSS